MCNWSTCQAPGCRCEGTDIPGNLPALQVPQMVMLTFDDGVHDHNYHYYSQLGLLDYWNPDSLTNPNGCPARATFFVSGDHTNMDLVRRLSEWGNEMASHTLTHGDPLEEEWDKSRWEEEVEGMRERLARAIGSSKVVGMRAPYLVLGGDDQYSMLKDRGFLYDSSMNGGSLDQDPIWPFTLDFPPTPRACDSEWCPAGSYPRLWEVPIVYHFTHWGEDCPMADACDLGGQNATKQDVLDFLWFNFNRSYQRNRAPYMVCVHATWFLNTRGSLEALHEFLHVLSGMNDVWLVTMTQMLDWVRRPLPLYRLHELTSWQC
ncbi:hypothetical protein BaRGS_00031196 [Batillaria attramentaria]|uniref:NodB homology domain-containing protein n=1 Tax=Batillaria attramentaria TaxID=370345 RepID=A0ABD0JRY1_9CAEN